MNRLVVLGLAIAAFLTPGLSRSLPPKPRGFISQHAGESCKAEQEVLSAKEERRQALLHNDAAAMEHLLADEFGVRDVRGKTYDKADEVGLYRGTRRQTESWAQRDVKVRGYGDTAVVTERAAMIRDQTRPPNPHNDRISKADSRTAVEQVWSAEEAYWRYVQSHDVEKFVALWSDDFVGWPLVKGHPVHKAEIASMFRSEKSPLNNVIAYELQRESVAIHGPIAITFYRAVTRRRNAGGSEFTSTSRVSHTWMNDGHLWQIVSGMGAADGQVINSETRQNQEQETSKGKQEGAVATQQGDIPTVNRLIGEEFLSASKEPRRLVTEIHRIASLDTGVELLLRNKRAANMDGFTASRTLLYVHGSSYPSSLFDLPLAGLVNSG